MVMIPSAALRSTTTSLRGRLPRRLAPATSWPHNHRSAAAAIGTYMYYSSSQTSSAFFGGTSHPSTESTSTYQTAAAAAMALLATSGGMFLSSSTSTAQTEAHDDAHPPNIAEPHPGAHPMPAKAGTDNICDEAPSLEELPVYRSSQVAKNDGSDGRPIWMSYGGVVYDVTGFIANHPGGSEKILLASGGVSCSLSHGAILCLFAMCSI